MRVCTLGIELWYTNVLTSTKVYVKLILYPVCYGHLNHRTKLGDVTGEAKRNYVKHSTLTNHDTYKTKYPILLSIPLNVRL